MKFTKNLQMLTGKHGFEESLHICSPFTGPLNILFCKIKILGIKISLVSRCFLLTNQDQKCRSHAHRHMDLHLTSTQPSRVRIRGRIGRDQAGCAPDREPQIRTSITRLLSQRPERAHRHGGGDREGGEGHH